MSADASKKLLEKTMNVDSSNVSSLVSQPSILDSLSIGNVASLKSKLLGSFNDLKSLQDITPSKLQGLTQTLGVDLGSFKKILNLSVKLEKLGILSGDKDLIKKKLLEEISVNNLLNVAKEGGVKKLIADSLKIDINELTSMFDSADQIKTLSDIKTLDQYEKLDDTFKSRIASDNGITVKMLDVIVASSVKLYSKEELERKQAEAIAKTLENDFNNLLFETQAPITSDDTIQSTGGTGSTGGIIEKTSIGDDVISKFDFSNNFTKVDYRIQKITALSLGFGDGEKSVDDLISTIEKLKQLAVLQKRERDLKKSLVNHLEDLQQNSFNNDQSIKDYAEECGVTDSEVQELIDKRNTLALELDNDTSPVGQRESELENDNTGDCIDGGGTFGERITLPKVDNDIELFEFGDIMKVDLFVEEDGKWSYNGDISFDGRELYLFNKLNSYSPTIRFPIKLYKLNGNLKVNRQGLTTLENMPDIITGNFDCSGNPLQNLNGMPKEIGGSINVSKTQISVLKNIQNDIKGDFNCSGNKIETLEGSPTYIRGNFDCSSNLLDNLSGSPLQVFGDMICIKNELVDLKGAPDEVQGTFDCSNNSLTQNPDLLRNGNTMRVRGKFICENQNSGKKLDATYLKDTFGASSVIV